MVELGDEFTCDQRAYRYKKKKLKLIDIGKRSDCKYDTLYEFMG